MYSFFYEISVIKNKIVEPLEFEKGPSDLRNDAPPVDYSYSLLSVYDSTRAVLLKFGSLFLRAPFNLC